jgi:hypothetical protein
MASRQEYAGYSTFTDEFVLAYCTTTPQLFAGTHFVKRGRRMKFAGFTE